MLFSDAGRGSVLIFSPTYTHEKSVVLTPTALLAADNTRQAANLLQKPCCRRLRAQLPESKRGWSFRLKDLESILNDRDDRCTTAELSLQHVRH